MKRLHIARCAPCSGNKPSLDIEEEYRRPAHSTVCRYGPSLGQVCGGVLGTARVPALLNPVPNVQEPIVAGGRVRRPPGRWTE